MSRESIQSGERVSGGRGCNVLYTVIKCEVFVRGHKTIGQSSRTILAGGRRQYAIRCMINICETSTGIPVLMMMAVVVSCLQVLKVV